MSEPVFHLTLSQLNDFARQAGRAGGEYVYERLAGENRAVVRMVEQSGAHKTVLSTNEAATYAGVGTGTIRRWVRDGMPATKVGGRAGFQIRKADIDDWRTRRSKPAVDDEVSATEPSVEGSESV